MDMILNDTKINIGGKVEEFGGEGAGGGGGRGLEGFLREMEGI